MRVASTAFVRAAKQYLQRPRGRTATWDAARAHELAKGLDFARVRPVVVAVPMLVGEQGLGRFLASVRAPAKRGLINVCVLVNATDQTCSARELAFACERHRLQVDAWNAQLGTRVGCVRGVHFGGAPNMGRVRRVLCDALIDHAANNAGQEPIIVCNDVDQLAVSPRYFESIRFALRASARPCAVGGPVRYGYAGTRTLGLPRGVLVPELYLFNEIQRGLQRCAAAGLLGPSSRVWPEGANMAFGGRAYCEAGGFDTGCATGEDDQLGMDLHRLSEGNRSRWQPMAFAESAWVATDPRRVLLAIEHGRTGMEAWGFQAFSDNPGATLDTEGLARNCARSRRSLTARNLRAFDPRVRDATWERVTSRVGWVFFRSLTYDVRARTFEQFSRVAQQVGICLLEGELDRKNGRLQALVDWGRSPLLRRLQAVAREA